MEVFDDADHHNGEIKRAKIGTWAKEFKIVFHSYFMWEYEPIRKYKWRKENFYADDSFVN